MDELSAAQQNHDAVHVILPYEKKGEFYIEPLGDIGKKPVYDFLKRFFDIFLSIGALAVLAIPMAVIALIIKKSSPGPVLYRQDRLGKDGVRFELLKFRTMRTDAEANGAQWSAGENDPRSLWLDFKILCKTVKVLLTGAGAK